MSRVRVASADELSSGQMTVVHVDGEDVLLARVGEEFFAVDNVCTHGGGLLEDGFLLPEACQVRCPLHGGRFDLRTGDATKPPATLPLTAYRVEVRDGEVLLGQPTYLPDED